jgi:hypothetical protein
MQEREKVRDAMRLIEKARTQTKGDEINMILKQYDEALTEAAKLDLQSKVQELEKEKKNEP